MTVRLVDYPIHPTDVIRIDHSVLDRLADGWLVDGDRGRLTMNRFLFGVVPLEVFGDLFADSGRIDDTVGRWLLHLSGYFGGRWLRGEIAAAEPQAPLVSFSVPPTEEAFEATMARAAEAVFAMQGRGDVALEFARASLLGSVDAAVPAPGLVDSFGYNAGYNMEILEAPPARTVAPDDLDVRCTGLLRCRYASPKLAALVDLAETAERLNSDDPLYAPFAAAVRPIQEAAIARGRAVWSSGLSVQGFGQAAYIQLLEVSSSFLETVQAAALTMVRALTAGDARLAATGARADAALRVWLDAYMVGLMNGEGVSELPTFV